MALLDNAPPVLREVLNYSYDEKVSVGINLVQELMGSLTRSYTTSDALDILLTLVIYAVSADHGVDEKERIYYNHIFGDYRRYYSLQDFHAALRRVNSSFNYDLMFHAFGQRKDLTGSINFLFWLFVCANGTVTADELKTFDQFIQRLHNSK